MAVRPFVSRPTLVVKTKQGNEVKEAGLTFVDSLKRFGKDMEQRDLDVAYARAGNSFVGQMQQTFVVLHESITGPRLKAQQIKERKKEKAKETAKFATARSDSSSGFRSAFGSGSKPRGGSRGGRGG